MAAPRVRQQARGEPGTIADGTELSTVAVVVDQVTVGVRNCTLTPKARPEILVTAGGAAAARNHHDNQNPTLSAATGNIRGPYLLVPPVNITAEISRPPLTPLQHN